MTGGAPSFIDGHRTVATAGILLAAATALGALGAHTLKAHLTADRLQIYDTAVRYHFFHSLGLLAVGLLLRSADNELLRWSAGVLLAGIVLFSGSLYLLAFGFTFGMARAVGIATPLGGLALIAGWILFAAGALRPTTA